VEHFYRRHSRVVPGPAVFAAYSFAFLGPLLGPLMPKGPGFMTLVSVLAAQLFMLLAFRVLFPGFSLFAERTPETPASLQALFREHGLIDREAEVARLMVMEGLSNQKIAERIFRSKFTVEKHTVSIYRKFGVHDRASFVLRNCSEIT
jgi:DNA-binding CsgD family transcriptional regulator